MNRQLEIECQARRRAEELYLEEMRLRIKMEEVLDKLQKGWSQKQDQGASQLPPLFTAPCAAESAHATPEEAVQRDGEARPTSTDTTSPVAVTDSSTV